MGSRGNGDGERMIFSRCIVAGAIAMVAAGCAGQMGSAKKPADSVLNRPMPASEEARGQECIWLRSEIEKEQRLVAYGGSVLTTGQRDLAIRAAAQRNIAALEVRAADIRCPAQ